jgi:hypothetical protein
MLRPIKKDLKGVAIIRSNQQHKYQGYINSSGSKDCVLCESFTFIQVPIRNDLRRVLDAKRSDPDICALAARADTKIKKLKGVKAIRRMEYAVVYRTKNNFAEIHPREGRVRIAVKETTGWKKRNIKNLDQFNRLYPRIKNAFLPSTSREQ